MKKPAPSRTHIKKRLDDYLWYDDSLPLVRLREILSDKFLTLGPVAIFGGLVRDLASKGASGFKSDVDLVVNADAKLVEQFALSANAAPNRFGGFSLYFPLWKIDFWALSTTWAHRQRHVRVRSFNDLTKCTFFTWDAIAYDIGSRSVIASDQYLRDVWARRLEINLLPNPSINGNLLRAVRRILSGNLGTGPKLRNFISENMSDEAYRYIVDNENRIYGNSYAELYGNCEELSGALLYKDLRDVFGAGSSTQLSLPL